LAHTVSPITDREAQLSRVRGGGNTRGFMTVQTKQAAIGPSDHQPTHVRLQIAPMSNRGIGIRV
jgi:hypothetical protein